MNVAQRPPQKKPTSSRSPKPKVPALTIIQADAEFAKGSLRVAKHNLMLAIVASISVTASLVFAFTAPSIDGYLSVDESLRIIEMPDVRKHDGVTNNDLYNFTATVFRECLSFTYLTKDYEVHRCLDDYFTGRGRADFSNALKSQLLPARKELHYDLKTQVTAVPLNLSVEPESVNGRAAWRVILPVTMRIIYHDREPQDRRFLITALVVRAYPDTHPYGLAVQGAVWESADKAG